MVPFWFTLSALCFVGAAALLYVDIGRRGLAAGASRAVARIRLRNRVDGDHRPLGAQRDVHRG